MKNTMIQLNLQHFAATKIADVVVPEVFNPYVIQRTAEMSKLIASGIVTADASLNVLASQGGKLINMPFWNDLTGDDEVLSDQTGLTVNKITASQDIAALLMRGKAWGANDLAGALAGSDPMTAIGELVAAWWARAEQKTLLSILKGVFASTSMTGNVHDISAGSGAAAVIDGPSFIDASMKLGDAYEKLTAVMMHSATFALLNKQNLIQYIPNSDGVVDFPQYMGKRVIVDDGCPVASGVYSTYLFGEGAIGRGEGGAPVPTEMDRDSLKGEDVLINRRHFLLHPRGVKFTSTSVTGITPTNAELATATNWARVYENKNIRIVEFKHKLA